MMADRIVYRTNGVFAVIDPRGVPATRETRKKLKRDIVERLYRQGKLGGGERNAAESIRRMWEAIGRGLMPRAGALISGGRGGTSAAALERLTTWEMQVWRHVYKPWADHTGRIQVNRAERVTLLQLTLEVVVDNQALTALEVLHRLPLREGVAREHLGASLNAYDEYALAAMRGFGVHAYRTTRETAA